jgi:hypothetical protein
MQVGIKAKRELKLRIAEIKKSLTLTKSKLCAQLRKKISAKDMRTSATSIGSVFGLGIIIAVIVSVVISDIPRILEHIKHGP